ncbi:uncharacterized protein Tco025E_09718 [Trypanosoma conorhini]|uniref:Uncharacterized protein n=1 Tax=Trypanosoma conorhini TaxID=83891 RepID=A0A422MTF6_9TRYP|nr:uncharacterized protein Tco025E_09718 [Trypanosoma conorhini]RNE96508.1 hypothetical protein Tco025E_09718 [Trypanosoma conorhini]
MSSDSGRPKPHGAFHNQKCAGYRDGQSHAPAPFINQQKNAARRRARVLIAEYAESKRKVNNAPTNSPSHYTRAQKNTTPFKLEVLRRVFNNMYCKYITLKTQ